MEGTDFWGAISPAQRLLTRFVDLIPRLVGTLTLFIFGIVLTLLLARMVRWFVMRSGLEPLAERAGMSRVLYSLGYQKGLPRLLGQITIWMGMLLTLFMVAESLGLQGIAQGISTLLAWLPRALMAALVALGGFAAADLMRRIVTSLASKGDLVEAPDALATFVFYLVLTIFAALALDQIGLKTALINQLILTAALTFGLTFALSIALAAQTTLRELILRHYADKHFKPGQRIILEDGRAGDVLLHTQVAIVLRVDRERVVIPYTVLMNQAVRVIDDLEPPPPPSGLSPEKAGATLSSDTSRSDAQNTKNTSPSET